MKVNVPPIKSQGIKTRLVPWINSIVPENFEGLWIDPFMGTGVVAFNIAPGRALLCDTNPHLVNFYNAISEGIVTPEVVRQFLNDEGAKLLEKGERHYYEIRDRFNEKHQPLDFLFLNRSGFNGMIRFNRKGGFNIPFCRKPNRFAQAYVTKIVNQVDHVATLLKTKDFTFKCQSFEKTIEIGTESDIIYCDPPYIGRHADYFNGWDDEHEHVLSDMLQKSESKFILSTWHHNDYRKNEYMESLWNNFKILTHEHFYHVGGNEKNRNPVTEAIVTNYEPFQCNRINPRGHEQLIFR
ncbi:DNA adenine methylase [Desulfonema ishimotonii]|uniref:Site-specific DNA-methyltransferase (adenine-specific) n=1 Tax=Desulfonema ishimotonii TaxID=45657 RepID=A0A401FYP3_9BACT|nr:Dam family site-specific DNA-(adenine-N6)-methyltransferase [Desulfonema ishimotonii]GBC62066.1 DNA adenine methylase [Desulfonema ishimotonii]